MVRRNVEHGHQDRESDGVGNQLCFNLDIISCLTNYVLNSVVLNSVVIYSLIAMCYNENQPLWGARESRPHTIPCHKGR